MAMYIRLGNGNGINLLKICYFILFYQKIKIDVCEFYFKDPFLSKKVEIF